MLVECVYIYIYTPSAALPMDVQWRPPGLGQGGCCLFGFFVGWSDQLWDVVNI